MDPTFDPPGPHAYLTKLAGPTVDPSELGRRCWVWRRGILSLCMDLPMGRVRLYQLRGNRIRVVRALGTDGLSQRPDPHTTLTHTQHWRHLSMAPMLLSAIRIRAD